MSSTRKITQYEILGEEWLEDLVRRVNKFIKLGWQPVGAVVVDRETTPHSLYCMYTQTMVKYEA